MRNEGKIERVIQATISMVLMLSGFFLATGVWQAVLFVFAAAICIFAAIGFCPLYAIIGRNTANQKNK